MSSPHTKVEVSGEIVDGLLDTGDTISLISNELINKETINQVQPYGKLVRDASNRRILIMGELNICLLYTSPSPRDKRQSRMPSSA